MTGTGTCSHSISRHIQLLRPNHACPGFTHFPGIQSTDNGSRDNAWSHRKYEIFLRTGFGDSKTFAEGGISIKTQGLTQGNGASPASWAVISICILGAHGKKGHGAKFVCPITKLLHHLSAILYVDDTDILHINLTQDESVNEVHNAIQSNVNSLGNLLITTGGVLQSSKCFYLEISFDWSNREWKYSENDRKEEFGITVPLPGGKEAPIDHKGAKHAKNTLDAMTSLNGDSSASLSMIKEKAQTWINAV